jgi:hypothetical protein
MIYLGDSPSTIADSTGTEKNWHMVAIVKYFSLETLRKFALEKAFQAAFEYKDASLKNDYVYACH